VDSSGKTPLTNDFNDRGDVEYRRQTLRHGLVDLGFDESVSLRALLTLWLRAVAISFPVWVVGFLLSLGSLSQTGSGAGLEAGTIIAFVVFWVVLLASRVTEPIGEWKALLEGKAAAVDSAYATICGVLIRRSVPVEREARRIRTDILPGSVSNYLVLRDQAYAAYVSVFAYGTGLYLGWTMWRTRSGAVVIWHFLKDMAGGLFGYSGLIGRMLRTEKARAMREAVHAAVREGVDAAVQGVAVSIADVLGHDLAVESLDSLSESPAVPPPPRPGPAGYAAPSARPGPDGYAVPPAGPGPAGPGPAGPGPAGQDPQPPRGHRRN
jgi:hypothetical protein